MSGESETASNGLRRLQAVLEVRVRYAAGVSREMPRAMLGGRPIVRGSTRRPPYWRHNWYWRQIYLSSYHVSRSAAPGYIAAIRRSGVQWLTGYGSAIAALAESAAAENVAAVKMRAVIVSGDTLQPGMRKRIESFFGCKCFDMYGLVEAAALAMECSAGRMHVIPDAGIVEILGPGGRPCAPGEVGEIVATGLLNDGMPLIRYRTGDTAALASDQACVCGSNHPILESLEGRVDDYLETTDGRQVGRLSTAMKRSPTIHSAQLVQDKPGHAYLLVRAGDGYEASAARAVVADIIERIGAFDIDVREVSKIPTTPTGKTRRHPTLPGKRANLPPGVSEFVAHPAYVDDDLLRLSTYIGQREEEREVLMDERFRDAVRDPAIGLSGYRDIPTRNSTTSPVKAAE